MEIQIIIIVVLIQLNITTITITIITIQNTMSITITIKTDKIGTMFQEFSNINNNKQQWFFFFLSLFMSWLQGDSDNASSLTQKVKYVNEKKK